MVDETVRVTSRVASRTLREHKERGREIWGRRDPRDGRRVERSEPAHHPSFATHNTVNLGAQQGPPPRPLARSPKSPFGAS